MLNLLVALIGLASPSPNLAFPLDYYTVDELAQKLTEPGVRYVPDSSLEADVYLLSLPAASKEKQIGLLSDGLGLTIEQNGATRKIRPDTAILRNRSRLQTQLIQNAIDGFQARVRHTLAVAADQVPLKLTGLSESEPLRIQVDHVIAQDANIQACLRAVGESSPPDISTLEDEGDTTAIYPRSVLSQSLAAAIDSLPPEHPPLTKIAFGYQTMLGNDGLRLVCNMVPIEGDDLGQPVLFPLPILREDNPVRKTVVDRQLKGLGSDPEWQDPGLRRSDREQLENREATTEELLSKFDDVASEDAAEQHSFSASLAFLAKAAQMPLIYKVNPLDDRLAKEKEGEGIGAAGFKSLFAKGAGYTARWQDGVLIVTDELDLLPSMKAGLLAALIETFHQKDPGHSIFEKSEQAHFSPIYLQDLLVFQSRAERIEKFATWQARLVTPIWVTEDDSNLLANSGLIVPMIRQLAASDWKRMAETGSVTLSDTKDFDKLSEYEGGLLSAYQIDHSTRAFKALYEKGWIEKPEIGLQKQGADNWLTLNVRLRTGSRSTLPLGDGRCYLSPDDPIVKRFPPQREFGTQ